MKYQERRRYSPLNLFLFLACATALHAQAPPTCPGPAAGTFTGCYYNNTSLSGSPALIRTDNQIKFDWGNGTPGRAISSENFSAVWQGNFVFAQGRYTFTVTASDGIRLYIDGQNIVDRWQDQKASTFSVSQILTQGSHLIVVEYFEQTGAAVAQVSWQNNVPATAPPVIASFTATPSVVAAGQSVTLSWNVAGASTVSIDNSVGEVRRESSVTVLPAQSTTYTLTASNPGATSTAAVNVTVKPGNQRPPSPPTLVSAQAVSANEVDLTWTAAAGAASTAGYQIFRSGTAAGSVGGSTFAWSDKAVTPSSTYTYTLKAYDAAAVYSAASNALKVTTPAATQPPTTCPAADSNAFAGCYFDNPNLTGSPAFVRHDSRINFYWGNSSPGGSLSPLNFSARWQGNFNFVSGNYTFTAIASDGLRLYVDGRLILNQWQDQAPSTWTVSRPMPEGNHLIVVEYYERTGQATAQLSWQPNAPPPNRPMISSFTATPATITPGQPVTLQWEVSGASTISIDSLGDVSGHSSVLVWPTETTTYTIRAAGPGGSTSANATVTVKRVPDTQPPSAPQLVSATAPDANAVNLVWTGSSDNLAVAGYQVLRNGSAVVSVAASTLLWSDHAITAGSVYTYAVRAFDAAGNYSAPSNSAQVAVPAPPSAPVVSSFTATPVSTIAGNPVTLDWAVSEATNISIDHNVGNVTDTSAVTVSPATTTTYTLAASNASGTSHASVTVTVTQSKDNQPPTTPTLVSATANGTNAVDLSWNSSTDNVSVAGYQVIRNGAAIAASPGAFTTYHDSTVTANSTYSYAVKAFDSAGNYSAESNAIQVSTPAASDTSATWYGACWYSGTVNGLTGNFQAVDFALKTDSPVALQGTLFFAPNCSAVNGTDNMNDNGATITSTHSVQGFSHYPDVIPSSAMYWFGHLTPDGTCPPGAPCSGCVNYTKATPSCDLLP